MDNLGVAINDTAIKTYAASKGMSKAAINNMTQQQKVALAFELFMSKTEDYAGNYEKENESYAGSINTLKAAWENFITGVGDVDGLMVAAERAFRVFLDSAKTLVPKLLSGAKKLFIKAWPSITKWLGEGVRKLPGILKTVLKVAANGVIDIINGIFGTNIPHIDKIQWPSWKDVQEAATKAWNEIKAQAQKLAGLVFGTKANGEVDWPDWSDVQQAAQKAWYKIRSEAKKAVEWGGALVFGRKKDGSVNWPDWDTVKDKAKEIWDGIVDGALKIADWAGGLVFGRKTDGTVNWPTLKSLQVGAKLLWEKLIGWVAKVGEHVGALIFGRDEKTGDVKWPTLKSLQVGAKLLWEKLIGWVAKIGENVGALIFGRDEKTGDVKWPDWETIKETASNKWTEFVNWAAKIGEHVGALIFGRDETTGDVKWPTLKSLQIGAKLLWERLVGWVAKVGEHVGALIFGRDEKTGDVNWPNWETIKETASNKWKEFVGWAAKIGENVGALIFGRDEQTGDVKWPTLKSLQVGAKLLWERLVGWVAKIGENVAALVFGRDEKTGDVNWPNVETFKRAAGDIWNTLVEWAADLAGLIFGRDSEGNVNWPKIVDLKSAGLNLWGKIKGWAADLGGLIFGRDSEGDVKWPKWTKDLRDAGEAALGLIQKNVDTLGGIVFGYKKDEQGNPVVDWPEGENIAELASAWWQRIKGGVQDVIDWAISIPKEPHASGAKVHHLLERWWNGIKSFVTSAIKLFFGIPTPEDKDGKATVKSIGDWWEEYVKPFLAGVIDFSLGLLGLPDAEEIGNQIHNWSRDLVASIGEHFGIDMSFLYPKEVGSSMAKLKSLMEVNAREDHSYGGQLHARETLNDIKNYPDLWSRLTKDQQKSINDSNFSFELLDSVIQTLQDSLSEQERAELAATSSIEDLGQSATHATEALNGIPRMGGSGHSFPQTGNGEKGDGEHAKGLWNVPYDGYQAILHRGERVLTASQARHESDGENTGTLSGMVADLKTTLSHLRLQVGEKEFGRTVADYGSTGVRRNIAGFNRRRRMGYGSV